MINSNRKMAAEAHASLRKTGKSILDFDQEVQDIVTKLLGLSENDVSCISFVNFLIFECEVRITGAIQKIMETTSKEYNSDLFIMTLEKLSLTQKIDVYENLIKQHRESYSDLIKGVKFFREMTTIRNGLFHSKIRNIIYKGKSIDNIKIKLKMLDDYMRAIGINPDTRSKKNDLFNI